MASVAAVLRTGPKVVKQPRLFEFAKTYIIIFLLFLFIEGNGLFSNASVSQIGSADLEQNATLAFLNAILWAVSACIILPKIRETVQALSANRTLALIALLAPLSSLWSAMPFVTFRRALLMDVAIIFAVYLVRKYSLEDLQKLILASGVVVALASIAMAIALPQYGLMPSGEWKGVFWHKNQLAQAMELLFSPLFFYNFRTPLSKLGAFGMAVLGAGVMVMSQARTGMLLTLAIIGVAIFARAIRRLDRSAQPVVFYSVIFLVFVAVPLLLENADTILVMLGKDPTLTGRLNTWPILIPYFFRHFLLGYGYSGFWTGMSGDSGSALSDMNGYMNTADNGYIDMALQFGIVGLVLLLILLGAAVRDFTAISRRRSAPIASFWYMALLLDAILGNFSGTFFFEPIGISTLTLVMGCVGLSQLKNSPVAEELPTFSPHKGLPERVYPR